MGNWQHFLQQQGARLQGETVISFANQPQDYAVPADQSALFDLSHLNVLRVAGSNARQLLQGQTTCDFKELTNTCSLLGAQCTPKGRAIASFRALQRTTNEIALLMPSDQIAAVHESLGKYAPFFKATLESDDVRIFGLTGHDASDICQRQLGCPTLSKNAVYHRDNTTVICVSNERYLLLTPPTQAEALWLALTQEAKPVATSLWTLLDIRDGIGEVVAATRELFIPQMINLQAIGGISFKKGCYTGQEVVARMHYLGKLKRRMYHLQIDGDTPPHPGTPCYLENGSQSVGNVVAAAKSGDQQIELLAVLTEQAASGNPLQFGDATAKPVNLIKLPYSLDGQ